MEKYKITVKGNVSANVSESFYIDANSMNDALKKFEVIYSSEQLKSALAFKTKRIPHDTSNFAVDIEPHRIITEVKE